MFYEKLAEAKRSKKRDSRRRFQLMAGTGALGLTGVGLMLRKRLKASNNAIDAARSSAENFKDAAEAAQRNTDELRQAAKAQEIIFKDRLSKLTSGRMTQEQFDNFMLDSSEDFIL